MMFLNGAAEVESFLKDFLKVIKQFSKKQHHHLKTMKLNDIDVIVEPPNPRELRILIQIYNELAQQKIEEEICLFAVFMRKFEEHGLYGVNPARTDGDLLDFFARYQLDFGKEKARDGIDDLDHMRIRLGEHHLFHRPVVNLLTQYPVTVGSDIERRIIELVAPKFGDEHAFDLDKRLETYNQYVSEMKSTAVKSGVKGAVVCFLGAVLTLGALAGVVVAAIFATPLYKIAAIGGALIAILTGACVIAEGARDVHRSISTYKCSALMFAISHPESNQSKVQDASQMLSLKK